jgi:hypothetical protein
MVHQMPICRTLNVSSLALRPIQDRHGSMPSASIIHASIGAIAYALSPRRRSGSSGEACPNAIDRGLVIHDVAPQHRFLAGHMLIGVVGFGKSRGMREHWSVACGAPIAVAKPRGLLCSTT